MDIRIFLPELSLIFMVLCFFAGSLTKKDSASLSFMGLVLSALSVVAAVYSFDQQGVIFSGAYSVDRYSQLFKVIICFGLFLTVYLGAGLKGIRDVLGSEYYMFLTFSALGMVMLVSAVELLTMIICLEISSFAIYVVIPFRRVRVGRIQVEAGIKYVLFGAAATGITLYGMGYIFGLTGTTYLGELVKVLPGIIADKPIAIVAMIMLLSGFFYKLALFPMHFWAPDVYQGASNETSGFIATIPKVGAVALLVRLVALAGVDINGFTWILAIFAVLSMTLGNFSALVQNDLKRVLAYSSIAHAGYMMVGILSTGTMGAVSAVYYVFGYIFMNLAAFYVIYHISPVGGNVTFEDLKGLYKRSPILAFTLAAAAFGMTGIPPTVGFTGKFLIFSSALQKGFYALVIIAVINAGISAFYYLKMVRAAYTTSPDGAPAIEISPNVKLLGVILTALILLVGIFPQPFTGLVKEAVALVG